MNLPLRLLLCFTTSLAATAAGLHAQSDAATLRVARNALTFVWTPLDTVSLNCKFNFIELQPPETPEGRPKWSGPRQRTGFESAANEGNQLSIPFEMVWRFAPDAPALSGSREAEYVDRRLIIRDTWETSTPKTNAGYSHEFVLNIAQYPDIELALIEPEPGVAVVNPRLRDHFDQNVRIFNKGISVTGKGFLLKNIGGCDLRITKSEAANLSVQIFKNLNLVQFRFMIPEVIDNRMLNMDSGFDLASGSTLFVLEWITAPTPEPTP
jgi:hypothetical protein